jgi:ABC-type glycerol-3-phosphate transport system permease component
MLALDRRTLLPAETASIIPVLAVYLGFHRQISAGMTVGAFT